MQKHDGSNIYFNTRSKGLKLSDILSFFKNQLTESQLDGLTRYFYYEKCNFIRVCENQLFIIKGLSKNIIDWDVNDDVYSQYYKKIEIPVITTIPDSERITELENRVKELEEQLNDKQTSPSFKIWEPNSNKFFANINNKSVVELIGTISQKYLTFPTKELAQSAIDSLTLHAKLLAYHAEFCPDYKHQHGEDTYTILFNTHLRKYYVIANRISYSRTNVCFPKDVANELVRKLNSGEVII